MDSCCAALKASANAVNVNRGGHSNGGTLFWGKRVRKNLKSRDLNAHLWKNLRTESDKGVKKIKPGVAYSVLTSDVNKETIVSIEENKELEIYPCDFFSIYYCYF